MFGFKSIFKCLSVLFISFLLVQCDSNSGASVNEMAPDFSLVDSRGKTVKLSDFKGTPVVLEWTNHLCPFVEKHYKSKNMQSLQKKYSEKGVVWLSIISSAKGKQGFVTGKEANQLTRSRRASPTKVLLDQNGKVARMYGAQTTPHMYIIDAEGKLIYKGAIDSIRSTDTKDIKKAVNYVDQAMKELMAKKPITVQTTKPYGCSVKY